MWVGQQGCQATRRAPQTVASISAAVSSVYGEKYLRETVRSFNAVNLVGGLIQRGRARAEHSPTKLTPRSGRQICLVGPSRGVGFAYLGLRTDPR